MKPMKMFAVIALLGFSASATFADEYIGYSNWFNRTELSIPQSGVITAVNIKGGDIVAKGAELISLDKTVFNANLQFRKVAQKQALMALAEAAKELERAKELFERTLISDHDLALANVAYTNAHSQQLEAEANLQLAKQQLNQSKVVAPFDARILKVNVLPYQFLNAQTENKVVAVIADSNQFVVEIWVKSSQLRKFNLNQDVVVKIGSTETSGKVYATELEPDADKGGSKVTIVMPYQDAYYSGMITTIIIP
jgi:multidrug efflux system membrane fusion protein